MLAPKLTSFATPRGGSCSGPAKPDPRKVSIGTPFAPKLTSFATPRGGSCSGPAKPDPRKSLIVLSVKQR
jgi:hypothetical protein